MNASVEPIVIRAPCDLLHQEKQGGQNLRILHRVSGDINLLEHNNLEISEKALCERVVREFQKAAHHDASTCK